MKLGKVNCLAIAVLTLALLVRFINFVDRINFGPEQAISLIVSGGYIKDKFSLLGLPNVQRTTTNGHIIFSGPMFNYSLVPLLLIFEFDPVPITAFFALLNVFTGLILFLVARKLFGAKVGFLAMWLFLFNDYMIYHSMFIWILNFLPLISLGLMFLLIKFKDQRQGFWPFVIGILGGVSFGLEYVFFFTLILVFGMLMWFSSERLKTSGLFILGLILGNFPTILFDLRNNFYHLNTLFQYLIDTTRNPGQSKISYYHFLQFWPVLALMAGYILNKFLARRKYLLGLVLLVYLGINLTSDRVSFVQAVGMREGLTYEKVKQAARAIAEDNPGDNFNVASVFDFDTRAHPLRYLLEFRYSTYPRDVEQYSNISSLYVFAPSDFDFNQTTPWEVSTFNAWQTNLKSIDQNYSVFKLTRQSFD